MDRSTLCLSRTKTESWVTYRSTSCGNVARQSKPLVQRQSGIHPMVEQRPVGKLVSSPKPPEAGGPKAKAFTNFTTRHQKYPIQLTLGNTHNPRWGFIFAPNMVFFFL